MNDIEEKCRFKPVVLKSLIFKAIALTIVGIVVLATVGTIVCEVF